MADAAVNRASEPASSLRVRVASKPVSAWRSCVGCTRTWATPLVKRSIALPNGLFGRRAPRAMTESTPASRVAMRTMRDVSR